MYYLQMQWSAVNPILFFFFFCNAKNKSDSVINSVQINLFKFLLMEWGYSIRKIVNDILKNIFNFQFNSHHCSGHNICFLIVVANSSLGHSVSLGPIQGSLALFFDIPKVWGIRRGRQCLWMTLPLHFKEALFILFTGGCHDHLIHLHTGNVVTIVAWAYSSITSYNYHFFFCVVKTFKILSLSNFEVTPQYCWLQPQRLCFRIPGFGRDTQDFFPLCHRQVFLHQNTKK